MKNTKMLKKNYEFKNILTKGKYYSGQYVEAFILKNNKKNNFLGLAISTKIGHAVTRNHIKRLIRESYKEVEETLEIGYSIVFLWKKKANVENAIFYNIKQDIQTIIEKSQISNE